MRAVLTTNYVVVTNVVVITNYVPEIPLESDLTDQASFSALGTGPRAEVAVETSGLPDLGWVPPPDTFDWIQLKSGEWLKGRLKAMQERKLEFDSEKMDLVTFDWKDVRQVRTSRTIDVLFADGEQRSGPVRITPGEVAVGGSEPRVITKDEVESLTPGGKREINYWSGKGTVGLTLRAGNSEQVEFNAQAELERRTPGTRFTVDYIGNFSSSGGVESVDNHRVNSEFDWWLSRRFFLILPFAEYYTDPFQNLAHRVTAGLGAGYDLIDRPDLEWNITMGPAYQKAWFESTAPGQDSSKQTSALVFGSQFDWEITHRVDWLVQYRGQFTRREVGETTHHAVSTLSLDLTRRLDLDVSLVWDRISVPKVGADGKTPKPDDFRLVVGAGVEF
jgi:putative salt-induced outer membrane protein YdiY